MVHAMRALDSMERRCDGTLYLLQQCRHSHDALAGDGPRGCMARVLLQGGGPPPGQKGIDRSRKSAQALMADALRVAPVRLVLGEGGVGEVHTLVLEARARGGVGLIREQRERVPEAQQQATCP